jgi:hypothetical protein
MTYRWNTPTPLYNVSGIQTGISTVRSTATAPSLNNILSPIYWWLYKKTGRQRHLERGDKLFNGTIGYDSLIARPAVPSPPLYNVKEFNELTRWTIDGLEWRASGVIING